MASAVNACAMWPGLCAYVRAPVLACAPCPVQITRAFGPARARQDLGSYSSNAATAAAAAVSCSPALLLLRRKCATCGRNENTPCRGGRAQQGYSTVLPQCPQAHAMVQSLHMVHGFEWQSAQTRGKPPSTPQSAPPHVDGHDCVSLYVLQRPTSRVVWLGSSGVPQC
jgi:hypothetical protein